MRFAAKKFILFLLILVSCSQIYAQDRLFAYTYQTNVLNKGQFDIEYQNTLKTGKKGAYSPYVFGQALKQRLEFEIGLGRKVQTAFYFNTEFSQFADTVSTEMSQELKVNFSNEWKWKLSDPVANRIGSALYAEIEFGGNNIELEGKLLLDKQFKKDLLAFNLVGKYEIEREIIRSNNKTAAEWEHSSPVELYLGYLHRFSPNFCLGFEGKNNNQITGEGGWMNSVVFAGPAIHSSVDKFFLNLSVLPQLYNLRKTESSPGSLDLNEFEKLEVRLLIGYSFR